VLCRRIAKKKYTNSAFDGEGSRRKGGRWPDFRIIIIRTPEDFCYDPRMWKEVI